MDLYDSRIYEPVFPPDAEEKKRLKRYYFRLSWIMIALLFVFTAVNQGVLTISAAVIGGGITEAAIDSGKAVIRSVPVMRAIYSYGFPIAADIAALGIGMIVVKPDLKSKLRFRGFTGTELLKFTAFSVSGVTIGALANMLLLIFVAVIAMIIAFIAGFAGYGEELLDMIKPTLPVSTVAPAVGNPLWLDVLIYLYICLLGPVLEELIFRGVMLEGLRKYGNAFGIIMSSVLFGLMHQNFTQCVPAICMGLIWATMAVKSGSLMPSILVHILNNTLSSVILLVMGMSGDVDIMEISANITESLPLLVVLVLNLLIRGVCIAASVMMVRRFTRSRRKLLSSGEYSKKRTWSYIFTSLPWLAVIGYMLVTTLTSIFM